jgi:hypothetical protein
MGRFVIWLQVTLDDNFAWFFVMPTIFALVLAGICYLGLWDMPPGLFLLVAGVFVAGWMVVALNNAIFVRRAFPVHGIVGPPGRRFRGYVNHTVSYEIDRQRFDTAHTFLKNEVKEGEDILLLVHTRNPNKIRVLQRAQDKSSLLTE